MRGTFGATHIVTFCYSYEEKGQIFSGLVYLHWENERILTGVSNGSIKRPFHDIPELNWNNLAQFIEKGTVTIDGLIFNLIDPSLVNKEAEILVNKETEKGIEAGMSIEEDPFQNIRFPLPK
jgi:hypothetical protein